MSRKLLRRLAPGACGLALILSVAGCGSALSKADVETQAQQALTEQVGIEAPPITCPGDLDATVGAEMTCTLSDGETAYDVKVTVTAINDDGTADFDVQVADTPQG